MRFDGNNLGELEVAVKDFCALDDVFFAPVMEVGCWVLLTAPTGGRHGSYQVLPNSVVNRMYEVMDVPPVATFNQVTCFVCKFYRDGFCTEYDEPIESELAAAETCPVFTPETF